MNIARISYDGVVCVSADLSNKIIFWNCQSEIRIKIKELNFFDRGYIFDMRLTRLARFLVIKTTSSVMIYEPK